MLETIREYILLALPVRVCCQAGYLLVLYTLKYDRMWRVHSPHEGLQTTRRRHDSVIDLSESHSVGLLFLSFFAAHCPLTSPSPSPHHPLVTISQSLDLKPRSP